MKNTLVSKNRAANELREQAHKLRAELMDASVQFTAEEVEKRTADIRALEMRAQSAAEKTWDRRKMPCPRLCKVVMARWVYADGFGAGPLLKLAQPASGGRPRGGDAQRFPKVFPLP